MLDRLRVRVECKSPTSDAVAVNCTLGIATHALDEHIVVKGLGELWGLMAGLPATLG